MNLGTLLGLLALEMELIDRTEPAMVETVFAVNIRRHILRDDPEPGERERKARDKAVSGLVLEIIEKTDHDLLADEICGVLGIVDERQRHNLFSTLSNMARRGLITKYSHHGRMHYGYVKKG